MTPISHKERRARRAAAIAAGLKTYDPGMTCQRGHSSPRRTNNDQCVACHQFRAAAKRISNAKANAKHERQRQKDVLAGIEPRPHFRDCPPPPVDNSCQCCGRIGSNHRMKNLSLDHCHASGAFRGWLCDNCNRGIGLLGDDIPGLMRAVEYLRRARDSQVDP